MDDAYRIPQAAAFGLKVTIVVGNPKPGSRTRAIAERFVEGLMGAGRHDVTVIDLADHAAALCPAKPQLLAALTDDNDLLVVASPTYKATYTGLLKIVLDQLRPDALQGVVAIPLMTGASAAHAFAVDFHLAPLLRELGAVVPTSGVYFIVNEAEDAQAAVSAAAARLRHQLALLHPLLIAGEMHVGNAVDDR